MSELQLLNLFIKERLTAAAVEIFGAIEKTLVVRYEEEITRSKQDNERLHRQLDMLFNPEIKLHRSDSTKPKFPASVKVELESQQQYYESSSSLDQENPEPLIDEKCGFGDDEQQLKKQDPYTDVSDAYLPIDKQIDSEQDAENNRERESVDHPSPSADPDWSPAGDVAKASSATRQAQLRSSKKEHRCSFCTRCFDTSRGLLLHLRSGHTKMKEEEEGGVDCPVCGKHINSKMHLKYHLRAHTGERPFVCHVCGRGFKCQSHLKEHLVRHTGERKFTCEICAKRFFLSSALRSHVRKVHNKSRLTCKTCDQSFASQYSLDIHLRQHTEDRAYSCRFCAKMFKTQSHLVDHERIHTGERPFRCTVCSASYKQSNNLRTHLRSKHNLIKVHKCRDCGKSMRGANMDLRGKKGNRCSTCRKYSENQEEKPCRCHVCGEMFQHVHNMKKHIVSTHKGQKPFRCVGCDKSFSTMCSFQEHMGVVHGRESMSLTDLTELTESDSKEVDQHANDTSD